MTRDSGPEDSNKNSEWDVDAMWARIRARTVDATAQEPSAPRSTRARTRRPRVSVVVAYAAAYAAALLIVAGAATVILRPAPGGDAPGERPGQYRTSRGQHATISLSDGTTLSLAPESRITISPHFADGSREIILDGEAAFTVRHDPSRPFRVRAHGALIEDVGTRFDLRAYAGEAVTVVVAEGSVTLRSARPESAVNAIPRTPVIVVDSGEVGTVDARGSASAMHTPSAGAYFEWTRGRLSFVDRPLPEVLRAIARWYDLEVQVTDARLAARRVTAAFAADSVAGAIDALALAMDATVQRNGRVLTLTPR